MSTCKDKFDCLRKKSSEKMEFIFQLFAELFSRSEAETQRIEQTQSKVTSVNNVAEYESEPMDSPLSDLNIFEFVDFH